MKKKAHRLTRERIIQSLELFNEKAKYLENSRFFQRAKQGIKVRTIMKIGHPITLERDGPDDDNIHAFALNIRFFVQDNEQSSFRNLKEIYDSDYATESMRKKFNTERDSLISFLDHPCGLSIYEEVLNRGKVFDVFLYGGFSHATKDKAEKFKLWMRDPETTSWTLGLFYQTCLGYMSVISRVEKLNNIFLKSLKETKSN